MKLSTFLFIGLFLTGPTQIVTAQTQLNNSGFEKWVNVGSATEEPSQWNSFKTASGSIAYLYGSKTITRSTVTRPGSTGTYSCLVWSKEPIPGTIANGLVTTGQVNMGNVLPLHQDNYDISHTADTAFSEALGAHPDSMVFYAKFKPADSSGTDSARMRAIIHDSYDYRDPNTSDAGAASHVVGDATRHFASTHNQWMRISVPFNYTGPATSPDYMLVTFTTNKTAGEGSAGDSLYIDDISLIYNPNGIADINSSEPINVYTDNNDMIINLSFDKLLTSKIALYDMGGQVVYRTQITAQNVQHYIGLSPLKSGIYIVVVTTDDGRKFNKKVPVK